MPITYQIIVILSIIIIILLFLWQRAVSYYKNVSFQKSSLASKYGKMSEQFMPFLKNFPYDTQNFRFLGSPIDGIQFEEGKIVLIEFKTAGSQLSGRQRQIAELVWQKKVEFKEIRLE